VKANERRVLVVDDEANQRMALASMLKGWGFEAETAANGQEALERIQSFSPHVMVTDLMMPVMDGIELLKRIRKGFSTDPPAIVLTAFGNPETAVTMVHDLGAFWFLEKPLHPPSLRTLIERAMTQSVLEKRSEIMEHQLAQSGVLGSLVGKSAPMQEVFHLIRQVAPTSATVLITGESGTGKELAARALHELSQAAAGPFIALNCAGIPDTLIESELFGHEKGAFTGAVERRRGCFELAQNGTIFLDEIGEMPIGLQAKLLRVLEGRKVRRLGAASEIDVNARVLAATNRPLEASVKNGSFREDLYFRLNVLHIPLPPLRDHLSDLAILNETLIGQLNARHQCRVTGLSKEAFDMLSAYAWPGNVRELRNVLERAVILAGEADIRPVHLPKHISGRRDVVDTVSDADGVAGIRLTAGTTVEEAERQLIQLTLKHTNNNKTRAAELLGVSLKTLFNKLKQQDGE
jgi:DNA-binding NtrC family response regulator